MSVEIIIESEKMTDKPLVSIIVPIYNVEQYLERCVESIVTQTYTDLEIILVDDGSPDSCPLLCDLFCKQDERITVIHKKRGGLSDARNAGIEKATGEVIAFVDSDDWLEKIAIEVAVKYLLQYEVDIVSFAANIIENEVIVRKEFIPFDKCTLLDRDDATKKILTDEISSQVWLRLYRKECWDGVMFPVGMLYEDLQTTYKVFLNALHGVCFIPVPLYNYRHNNEGISKSFNPQKAYHIFLGLKEHYYYASEYYPDVADQCLKNAVVNGMSVINSSLDSSLGGQIVGTNDVYVFMFNNEQKIKKVVSFPLFRKLIIRIFYRSNKIYTFLGKLYLAFRKMKNK